MPNQIVPMINALMATCESPFKGIRLQFFVNRLKIQLTRFGASLKPVTPISGNVFSEKSLGFSGIRLLTPKLP